MGGPFWTLRRTAALLKPPASARKGLPRLLAFTDPQRTPDLEALAQSLPPGAALVYRTFGAADALSVARRLRTLTGERKAKLLIGADEILAAKVEADGVHLPERSGGRVAGVRARHPTWLVTLAAHSPAAIQRARLNGADAAVLAVVFPSRSPSAGRSLGVLRLAQLARSSPLPLYALGGVNDDTAARLAALPLAGLAAVEGLGI